MEKDRAWSEFVGNSHGKRAVEVALAGNHSITLVGNPGNGKAQLEVILGKLLYFISPCSCGNMGDILRECSCTPAQINRYHSTKKYQKAMNGDIIIEVMRPRPQDYDRKDESFSKVLSRIDAAKNVAVGNEIDQDSQRLLEMAINKLGFTISAVHSVKSVAKTIAALEGVKTIKTEHLAEAIQYKALV